jgi:hypothetical protein
MFGYGSRKNLDTIKCVSSLIAPTRSLAINQQRAVFAANSDEQHRHDSLAGEGKSIASGERERE